MERPDIQKGYEFVVCLTIYYWCDWLQDGGTKLYLEQYNQCFFMTFSGSPTDVTTGDSLRLNFMLNGRLQCCSTVRGCYGIHPNFPSPGITVRVQLAFRSTTRTGIRRTVCPVAGCAESQLRIRVMADIPALPARPCGAYNQHLWTDRRCWMWLAYSVSGRRRTRVQVPLWCSSRSCTRTLAHRRLQSDTCRRYCKRTRASCRRLRTARVLPSGAPRRSAALVRNRSLPGSSRTSRPRRSSSTPGPPCILRWRGKASETAYMRIGQLRILISSFPRCEST